MPYNPDIHHRRSIRLKGYDYALAGAYFVTIVTQGRVCMFGDITNGVMQLNAAGQIVQAAWDDLPQHYPHMTLDAFVVMPNHVHGVIILMDTNPQTPPPAKRHGLPEIVRAFKSFSARRINLVGAGPVGAGLRPAPTSAHTTAKTSVWQRNYYEHIIRTESELYRIRDYIAYNPQRWALDKEHYDDEWPTQ